MSFTEPNDEEEPQVDPAILERARVATTELEDAGRKLGLYQQAVQLGVNPDGHAVLIASFLMGDVAFSDRVQNPAQDTTEDAFRTIVSEEKKSEFNELQERLRDQYGGGTGGA